MLAQTGRISWLILEQCLRHTAELNARDAIAELARRSTFCGSTLGYKPTAANIGREHVMKLRHQIYQFLLHGNTPRSGSSVTYRTQRLR